MLDKSLIYKDIVMCLPFEDLEDLKVPVLPDGYSYKMFESGDEIAWAKLEVLVGEFDCCGCSFWAMAGTGFWPLKYKMEVIPISIAIAAAEE